MWVVLGTVAIVGAMIGVGLLLDRWLGLLPRPEAMAAKAPTTPAAGETALAAIRATAAARARVLTRQRCCSVTMTAGAEDPVVLGGKPLLVVRLTCPVCRHHRPIYFEPAA